MQGVLSHTYYDTLSLRYYQNDYFPDEESELVDFTEATYSGYAAVFLGGTWTPEKDIGGYGRCSYPATGIPHNGGTTSNLIYGYYLTGPDLSVIWAERFDGGPFLLQNLGDDVITTPRIGLRSEFNQGP